MNGCDWTISGGGGLGLLLIGCCILFASCSSRAPDEGGWNDDPTTLLEESRGEVLVVLMGMKGCDGTAAATEVLKDYVTKKQPGVTVARVDVPPPTGAFKPLDKASLPFEYRTDSKRVLADKLDFFYYPTLYIFGPEGELRYSGDCNAESLPDMVSSILGEKPGDERQVFTPPLLKVGTAAPAFASTTLAGDEVTLDALRGLRATALIFAKTKCRFTMEAIPGMKKLDDTFREEGVSVMILNREESVDVIRPIYDERAPGVTVVHDKDGEIAKSYGVPAVPFLFLLDGEGRIATRMPFTQATAEKSIMQVLDPVADVIMEPVEGAG